MDQFGAVVGRIDTLSARLAQVVESSRAAGIGGGSVAIRYVLRRIEDR
jgi:hypothetical protein